MDDGLQFWLSIWIWPMFCSRHSWAKKIRNFDRLYFPRNLQKGCLIISILNNSYKFWKYFWMSVILNRILQQWDSVRHFSHATVINTPALYLSLCLSSEARKTKVSFPCACLLGWSGFLQDFFKVYRCKIQVYQPTQG